LGYLRLLELAHHRCLGEELGRILGHEDLERGIDASARVRRARDVVDGAHRQSQACTLAVGPVLDRVELRGDAVELGLGTARPLGRGLRLHLEVPDLLRDLIEVLARSRRRSGERAEGHDHGAGEKGCQKHPPCPHVINHAFRRPSLRATNHEDSMKEASRPDNALMADTIRVLVVDDEKPLVGVITSYLEREGFEVVQAFDGPTAVDRAREDDPALVLLDLMLPGIDGIEVCRQIRQFTDAYVIILTARDEEVDKLVGLSVGADDYLVKPFSPRELIARIRAMLRRPRQSQLPAAEAVVVGALVVDLEARLVLLDDEPVDLTRTEFDLLAAMLAKPRAALSRRSLIDDVWCQDWYGDEHVVDVHIGHLRRKLGDDANDPRFIRTVRGVGYGLGSG
jgi:DNA-binding response OmpR family regulator